MAKTKKSQREAFVINEEMIRTAASYIPHARKKAIAKATAKECLEAADNGTAKIAEETSLPIPQLYREECGAKSVHLMYFFLTEYLNLGLGDEFSEEEFDYYASAHPINQLERMKSGDVEIKNKVFDLLYDYKQLKSMIEVEIYNLKETRNNGIDRIQKYLDLFSKPENITMLNNLLQKTIAETEEEQKKLAEKRGEAKAETKPTEE